MSGIYKIGDKAFVGAVLIDPITTNPYIAGTPPSKYATPKGDWNANTNTPALGTGVGADGDYYRVSVAGATAFDFVSNANVPDIIYRQNGQWFIDRYSASASSVFVNNPVGNPVPVNLVQASGTAINITAGDINVGLTDTGVNYDSVRIGDGTDLLAINVDGSINTNETIIAGQQNFGVTTNSKRTASVLGNTTGQIDYNIGTPTAQTIRTAGIVTDGVDTMLVNTDGSINTTETIVAGQQNFGVTTNSKRIAGVIGNSTGELAYNVGISSAQTLRTASLIHDGVDTLAVNIDGSINTKTIPSSNATTIASTGYTNNLPVNTTSATILNSGANGASHLQVQKNSGAIIDVNIGLGNPIIVGMGGDVNVDVNIPPAQAITITPRVNGLSVGDYVTINIF